MDSALARGATLFIMSRRSEQTTKHDLFLTTLPLLYALNGVTLALRTRDSRILKLSAEEARALAALTSPGSAGSLAIAIHRQETLKSVEACSRHAVLKYLIPIGFRNMLERAVVRGDLDPRSTLVGDEMITSLRDLGLVARWDDIFGTASQMPVRSGRHLDFNAIFTCDRPNQIDTAIRSLLSIQSSSKCSSEELPLLIIDDSRDKNLRERTIGAVKSASGGGIRKCKYLGMEERERLVGYLIAEHGIPPDVVHFALRPVGEFTTVGAARNLLSLVTAGTRVLAFDDDIAGAVPPDVASRSGVSIVGDDIPYEIEFAPYIDPTVLQPLANSGIQLSHGEVLGCSVKNLCIQADRIRRWPALGGTDLGLPDILSGRVRISTMGSIGDSGTHSMAGMLLFTSRKDMSRLSRAQGSYRNLIVRREIARRASSLTLTRKSYLQAMCLGIDNRELIPPFSPFGRNEDHLFAHVFIGLQRDCWIAHLPGMVVHLPERRRVDSVSYVHGFSQIQLNELLMLCFNEVMPKSDSDLKSGLILVGELLEELGNMDHVSAFNRVASLVLLRQQGILRRVSLRRQEITDRRFLEDLSSMADSIRLSMADPLTIIPAELQNCGIERARAQFLHIVRMYGRLLQWWPEMWQAAKAGAREIVGI